jgi:hypothetical protein
VSGRKLGLAQGMAGVGLAVTLAACAGGAPKNAPDWYLQAMHQEAHSYPRLRDVPRTSDANTNAAYWAGVEADVLAARQAMLANPRSQWTPPEDATQFNNDARAAIDASRDQHH